MQLVLISSFSVFSFSLNIRRPAKLQIAIWIPLKFIFKDNCEWIFLFLAHWLWFSNRKMSLKFYKITTTKSSSMLSQELWSRKKLKWKAKRFYKTMKNIIQMYIHHRVHVLGKKFEKAHKKTRKQKRSSDGMCSKPLTVVNYISCRNDH